MKTVTIIPARGGSKGIPYKNITFLAGKPLISYSIQASLGSNVNDTYVCTDDEDICNVSCEHGAKVVMRPDYLCDDIIMPDPTLVYFANEVEFDDNAICVTAKYDDEHSEIVFHDNKEETTHSEPKSSGKKDGKDEWIKYI